MGEGGAVFTTRSKIRRAMESIRDWGRDCYCDPGKDNTCGHRFDWMLGDLQRVYDHKYIYSHLGYNMKIHNMQTPIDHAQLDQHDSFISPPRPTFPLPPHGLKK